MIILLLYLTRLFHQRNRGLNCLRHLLLGRILFLLLNAYLILFYGFEDALSLLHAAQSEQFSSSMPFALEEWYGFNYNFCSFSEAFIFRC